MVYGGKLLKILSPRVVTWMTVVFSGLSIKSDTW